MVPNARSILLLAHTLRDRRPATSCPKSKDRTVPARGTKQSGSRPKFLAMRRRAPNSDSVGHAIGDRDNIAMDLSKGSHGQCRREVPINEHHNRTQVEDMTREEQAELTFLI